MKTLERLLDQIQDLWPSSVLKGKLVMANLWVVTRQVRFTINTTY